jgi:hypothetical protein
MIIEMTKVITGTESQHIEDSREKMKADEQARMRKERLEMWASAYTHNIPNNKNIAQWNSEETQLRSIKGPTEKIPADQKTQRDQGNDSEEDSESESETREELLPNVTEMEHFFLNSRPFKAVLDGFRELLLPPSLRDILPASSVEISTEEDSSMSNRVKGFIEDFTMLDWDWWPLRPRMRALEAGERRLIWTCVSEKNLLKQSARNFVTLTMDSRAAQDFGKK